MLNLLQIAKANAEAKKLNPEKLVIKKCICSSSQWRKKKNLYAHGSINTFCSSNCHVEILCEELKEKVKKKKKKVKKKKLDLLVLWNMLEELLLKILVHKNMLKLEEKNK